MVLENLKNLYRKFDGFRNYLPENVNIIGLVCWGKSSPEKPQKIDGKIC